MNIFKYKNYIYRRLSRISTSYINISIRKKLIKSGIVSPVFILSLDCDTCKDAEIAEEFHNELLKFGIKPIYAVPGELLIRYKDVYKKIYRNGGYFINHGYYDHTFLDSKTKKYLSKFFYEKLSKDQIEEDIILGHNAIKSTLQFEAIGFRSPHFGTYQSSANLNFLYSVLKKLNYKFSSSTVPLHLFKKHKIFDTNFDLLEFPLSGFYSDPFTIVDSWTCFEAPNKKKTPKDYLDNFNLLDNNPLQPIFINIYVDPSHVYKSQEFYNSLSILNRNYKNIDFLDLLNILNK